MSIKREERITLCGYCGEEVTIMLKGRGKTTPYCPHCKEYVEGHTTSISEDALNVIKGMKFDSGEL